MKAEDFKVGERVHDIGWGDLLDPANGVVFDVDEGRKTVEVRFDNGQTHRFCEYSDLKYLVKEVTQ